MSEKKDARPKKQTNAIQSACQNIKSLLDEFTQPTETDHQKQVIRKNMEPFYKPEVPKELMNDIKAKLKELS